MSDTGTPAESPATLIEQDGAVPETFIPAEHVEEAVEPIEAQPEPTETPAPEAEKPKQKPWFQTRIDELTRQKHEAAREAKEAKDRLALIEGQQEASESPPKPVFTEAAFNEAVKAEARRVAAFEAQQARTTSWVQAGEKEFGKDGFTERCNMVAAMGAGENPDFMAIVTDPDILPDGYRVIDALAAQPEEAQRILSLPPIKMAAALTRLHTASKPVEKPISAAPKPIPTTGGTAKSSGPKETDDIKAWMAERNKTAWDARKN